MSKRTRFTTVTPLPAGIGRETVLHTLHDHLEMIDLNPLVEERHATKPPPNSTAEEYHCKWYSLTDRVQYLPGGLASGKVIYNVCFHDLAMGLQTHCYAPMGLDIKGKWTLGGSLPGEPVAPVELGVGTPLNGLWIREDVDMKCNIMMTGFVKKTLKKAHAKLVDRIVIKAQIVDAGLKNQHISAAAADLNPPLSAQSSLSIHGSFLQHPIRSPGFNPYPHLPPTPSDHAAYRDDYESTLYPKPLITRSLIQSCKSHSRQLSFPESPAGNENAGARVSWQNLNPAHARSPSMQEIDLACRKASAYHRDSTMRDLKLIYPGPPPPPKVIEPVELE